VQQQIVLPTPPLLQQRHACTRTSRLSGRLGWPEGPRHGALDPHK
jgi:hypothetical protein